MRLIKKMAARYCFFLIVRLFCVILLTIKKFFCIFSFQNRIFHIFPSLFIKNCRLPLLRFARNDNTADRNDYGLRLPAGQAGITNYGLITPACRSGRDYELDARCQIRDVLRGTRD
jgi:hypothetical protein